MRSSAATTYERRSDDASTPCVHTLTTGDGCRRVFVLRSFPADARPLQQSKTADARRESSSARLAGSRYPILRQDAPPHLSLVATCSTPLATRVSVRCGQLLPPQQERASQSIWRLPANARISEAFREIAFLAQGCTCTEHAAAEASNLQSATVDGAIHL